MIRAFVNRLRGPAKIKLGRWDTKKTFQTNDEIKALWNSADHCGDNICGNPILVKDIIYSKINKEKDNEFCCRLMGMNSCGNCNLLK